MLTVEYFDAEKKELKKVQAEKVLFGDKKAAIIIDEECLSLVDIPIYYLYSIK